MRQTLSRGMVAAAAATGILTLCGGAALADSSADGVTKGSPGAASGNTVQAPVDVPVNACGNTVDVAAALNPAFGNSCADEADTRGGHGDRGHGRDRHDASGHGGGSDTFPGGGERWSTGDGERWSPGDGEGRPGGDGEDRPHDDGEDRSRGEDEDRSHGDDGYGDDGGYGYGDGDGGYGYGDTPPTKPPHTPPTKPPHTPPPTEPPHTPPPGGHESTPPGTPPGDHHTPPPPGGQEQPPSLPETGAEALFGAAATSAALIVSGVVLYRRGRAASHR
ncbi:chaplin [Streptomyces sp. NPDC029044]|uniref:chaplin n=1 Tax=Streptomyces sp. NPDC029044 TaxID=3157198 RepID=UPI0033C619D1